MSAVDLIAAELARVRAVPPAGEGFGAVHDDEHVDGELIHAAQSYIMQADGLVKFGKMPPCFIPKFWPFERLWWKPDAKDPVRNLVLAGMFIAAEIERLQRRAAKGGAK